MLGFEKTLTLAELCPYIGEFLQSYRISKLEKRLKSHEIKIEMLLKKVTSIDDNEFVAFLKEFLFPSTLQMMLDEEEDSKTGLFLNGFETATETKINDESRLLIYYDVIRELRFIEIQYLIYLFNENESKSKKNNQNSISHSFFDKKLIDLQLFSEAKLAKFSLIRFPGQVYVEIVGDQHRMNSVEKEQKITSVGIQFLRFFKLIEESEAII